MDHHTHITPEKRQNMQKASQAQKDAVKRLIELHQMDYERLHKEERIKRGLPGDRKKTFWTLLRENEKLREELEALKNGS